MPKHTLPPLHNPNNKAKEYLKQVEILFQYLQEHTATASMAADATGLPHKNICRYKRFLEKAGKLWQVEQKFCLLTGYKAWYLTTDPKLGRVRKTSTF